MTPFSAHRSTQAGMSLSSSSRRLWRYRSAGEVCAGMRFSVPYDTDHRSVSMNDTDPGSALQMEEQHDRAQTTQGRGP